MKQKDSGGKMPIQPLTLEHCTALAVEADTKWVEQVHRKVKESTRPLRTEDWYKLYSSRSKLNPRVSHTRVLEVVPCSWKSCLFVYLYKGLAKPHLRKKMHDRGCGAVVAGLGDAKPREHCG